MTASIPETEPTIVTKGDTLKFKIWLDDYKPGDSWVLTYALVKSDDQVEITASDNGDGFHLVSESVTWNAGVYKYQAYVTKSGERYTVRRGTITVKADFASEAAGLDGRGKWTKFVEQLEDALVAMTAGEIKTASVSHNNRSYEYRSIDQLQKALTMARTEANREEQIERLNEGKSAGNRIRMKF